MNTHSLLETEWRPHGTPSTLARIRFLPPSSLNVNPSTTNVTTVPRSSQCGKQPSTQKRTPLQLLYLYFSFLITPSSIVSSLEDAMLKALPRLFPNLLGTTSNPRVEFYEKFHRAADERDRGFVKTYDEDLNTTLIFVSLFSAHPSTFGNLMLI